MFSSKEIQTIIEMKKLISTAFINKESLFSRNRSSISRIFFSLVCVRLRFVDARIPMCISSQQIFVRNRWCDLVYSQYLFPFSEFFSSFSMIRYVESTEKCSKLWIHRKSNKTVLIVNKQKNNRHFRQLSKEKMGVNTKEKRWLFNGLDHLDVALR